MKEVLQRAYELFLGNSPLVIATITEKTGSTPRAEGSSMIVTRDGYDSGTIGGGAQEYQAIEMCKKLIEEKKSGNHKYILTTNEAEDIGMVCGGTNHIHFEYIDPRDEVAGEYLKFVLENYKEHSIFLVYDMENTGFSIEVDGDLRAFTRGQNSDEIFKLEVKSEPKMFVFGGGHVAQATVPLLNYLGYETIVVENREEFLKEEDFPNSKRYLVDYEHIEKLNITSDDYVIILTRGHVSDKQSLKSAIEKNPKYIGVIGSRRKALLMFKEFEENGYDKEILDRVFSPVGLDIGAETPREIAVSIAAQIIQCERGLIR